MIVFKAVEIYLTTSLFTWLGWNQSCVVLFGLKWFIFRLCIEKKNYFIHVVYAWNGLHHCSEKKQRWNFNANTWAFPLIILFFWKFNIFCCKKSASKICKFILCCLTETSFLSLYFQQSDRENWPIRIRWLWVCQPTSYVNGGLCMRACLQ